MTEGWGEYHDTQLEESVAATPGPVIARPPVQKETLVRDDGKEHHAFRETSNYNSTGEITKSYVRYDWEKVFEHSIKTPFPEEWSPAMPYLYEAYKLEKEGVNQQRIQELLEEAKRIDANATNTYLIRQGIIKKRGNSKQQ